MPPSPSLSRALLVRLARHLPVAERSVLERVVIADAGHGYDRFGLSRDYVALALALTGPVYRHYFRVRSVGVQRLPRAGGAIMVSNHSGTLPFDGMMIWADVVRRTARVPRVVADVFVPALPFVWTLFARAGAVAGSRHNVEALLSTGELLLIFPEGVPGVGKPVRERYQLRPFRLGHAELALRHRVPLVPVAVVGAEEQMPQLLRLVRLGHYVGLPYVPVPLTPLPLPVRYHIYYGEPIDVSVEHGPDAADDPRVLAVVAERVRAAVGELLALGLRQRRGVFR